MDVTPLIFVALAVAWAVYLVPKTLQTTDEASVSHSVERFSSALRVLGRREEDAATVSSETTGPVRRPSTGQARARREAARAAAKRRRRVLGVLVVLNAVVAVTAGLGVIGWVWQGLPATLLVAWLVTCRLMVRSEQAARVEVWAPTRVRLPRRPESPVTASPADQELIDEAPAEFAIDRNEQGFDEVAPEAETTTIPAVTEGLWDPVPVTLPTYVTKPAAARRTVRTIDLGAPGAWTSGRTEEDTAIAREADEVERQAKLASIARRIRKSS